MADFKSGTGNKSRTPVVPESKEVLKDCWDRVKRNLLLTKLQEIPTSQS